MIKIGRSGNKALSYICISIAQIFFAATIGALVVLPVDVGKLVDIILKLGLSLIFWIMAIMFAHRGKL